MQPAHLQGHPDTIQSPTHPVQTESVRRFPADSAGSPSPLGGWGADESQVALQHDPAALRLAAALRAAFEVPADQINSGEAGRRLRQPSTEQEKEFVAMLAAGCSCREWRGQKLNGAEVIRFIDAHPEIDVNLATRSGTPMLGLAIVKGRLNLVKKLLERGADPDVSWRNREGGPVVTPLFQAIQQDTAKSKYAVTITPLLLKKGAGIERARGRTLIEYARSRHGDNPKNASEIVAMLEEAIKVECGNNRFTNVHHEAQKVTPENPRKRVGESPPGQTMQGVAKRPRTQATSNDCSPGVDEPTLNKGSELSKEEIQGLMPFNIIGNKSHLLAKSIGGLLEEAAKISNRVIDAFGGAGTYMHYLRRRGISHEGDILNEYDSMRAITHRQIATNPGNVVDEASKFADALHSFASDKGIQTGRIFTMDTDSARKELIGFVREKINSQIFEYPPEGKSSVMLQDTAKVAGMYLVLQAMSIHTQPVQSEIRPYGFAFPGFKFVEAKGGNEKVGHVKIGGTIHLFDPQPLVDRIRKKVSGAAERTKNLDVRQGDGWQLIANEAGKDDLVTIDSSYLHPALVDGRKTRETINYNRDTDEDADPDIYKQKLQKYVLPAWGRGARLLITNNWDEDMVSYLRSIGFSVWQSFRQGARISERQTGAPELIAINFNPDDGAVIRRASGDLAPAAG